MDPAPLDPVPCQPAQPDLLAAGAAFWGWGGAHEFDGAARRWNVAGVPAYLQAVRDRRRPTEGEERLDPGQARFEALALRLRTADGLDLSARGLHAGGRLGGPQAQELRRAGLLAPGAGLRLTEKGMFLHGEVVARLVKVGTSLSSRIP